MYDHYNFDDATAYQIELAKRLKFEPLKKISIIAGADISFNKNSTTMYAGIVILTYPGMVLKSFALATYETSFPYKAGFLGFKEVPALLKVWELIADKPDVVYSATEIKNNAGEMLGFALRTKINCAPVYISAGHLITQEESLEVIKKSIANYRIPEPTRMAHNLVNDFRTGKLKAGFHEVLAPLTLF
ncbi:endonuclease V [Pedobacter riviphilus]|uniref:Endonuclease V n=1 Tax=Pedobacter riviphilus TaxID=2766984 RepID=A0ABX6TM01_9SPHI|nr:endonuclease V [Pedobacter riviphilus]QNR86583.1 endonuclease V [Pedobacter riviphilus]